MERRLVGEACSPAARGKGKGLPTLHLANTELDMYRKTSDALWLARAAVVVELLSRHAAPPAPGEGSLRRAVRNLFGAGKKYPTVSADALLRALVADGGLTRDASALFKNRWIVSNVVPVFDVGTLYDANKGFLKIACRQEGVGFLKDNLEPL